MSTIRYLNNDKKADKKLTEEECVALSQDLQAHIKRIKADFMIGEMVDYKSLRDSEMFAVYKTSADKLTSVDLMTLSETQKKAFFINVYNSLTIHGIASLPELPDSVLKIAQFWRNTAYYIDDYQFSLDDMEHGVLRANRSHPASSQPNYFNSDDVRIKFALKQLDPRIHFALNCGARSCPAILSYSADNLDAALDKAARSFCNQEVIILPKNEEIYVSKLFEWYESDFGNNDISAVKWTLQYLDKDKQSQLGILLQGKVKVGVGSILYNEYDWALNSTFH